MLADDPMQEVNRLHLVIASSRRKQAECEASLVSLRRSLEHTQQLAKACSDLSTSGSGSSEELQRQLAGQLARARY